MASLLNRLAALLLRLHRFFLRHPRPILILALIGALALGRQTRHLRFILSSDDLVEDRFTSVADLRDMKAAFNDGNATLLLIVPPPPRRSFTEDELCRIRRWLAAERIRNPEILDSTSLFDVRHGFLETPRRLYYPPLLELKCDALAENAATATARIAAGFRAISASPWGFLATGGNSGDLGIQFIFRDAENYAYGSFDPRFLKTMHERFEQELGRAIPGLKSHWVGSADYQYAMREGLARASLLNLLFLLFLVVALRLAFGTWKSGLIFVGTLVFSGVCLYGAKGLSGSPFDALSNSLFLMLGVATLEDFIFVSYQQLRYGTAWSPSIRMMILPGFLTSLTTILGFASLCTSELGIIRRLGFWSAAGALLEWIVIFLLLPAGLKLVMKKHSGWTDPSRALLSRFIQPLGGRRLPRRWSLACMAVYFAAVFSFFHLNVNDAPHLLFTREHPFRKGLDYVLSTRDWQSSVSLVFQDLGDEAFNRDVLTRLKAHPNVAAAENVYDMRDYLTRGMDEGKAGIVRREFSITDNYRRLVDGDHRTRANLYLRRADLMSIRELRADVGALCGTARPRCHLAGGLIAYADFANEVPRTLLDSMLTSLLLVALVLGGLAWALGRARLIPAILATSFWGPVLMVAAIALLQIKVNFLTCIFASVLVGLTGDNAIQYLLASKGRALGAGSERRGGASVQCSLMMALGSLLFLGSYFGPPRIFGLLLCGGFLVSLVGDLWILNGLVSERTE